VAPAAGPFPSEAAIYAATDLSATGIRQIHELSRGFTIPEAWPERGRPTPLYMYAGIPLPGWLPRSGI
jgi:hypothetical protein